MLNIEASRKSGSIPSIEHKNSYSRYQMFGSTNPIELNFCKQINHNDSFDVNFVDRTYLCIYLKKFSLLKHLKSEKYVTYFCNEYLMSLNRTSRTLLASQRNLFSQFTKNCDILPGFILRYRYHKSLFTDSLLYIIYYKYVYLRIITSCFIFN